MEFSCSRCQAQLPQGSRFCPQCGLAFDQPVPDFTINTPPVQPVAMLADTTNTSAQRIPGKQKAVEVNLSLAKKNVIGFLKFGWYFLIILFAVGAFQGGSNGDMTCFWLVLVCGLPTIWLDKKWNRYARLVVTALLLVSFIGYYAYSRTPAGKAAFVAEQANQARENTLQAQKAKEQQARENILQAQKAKEQQTADTKQEAERSKQEALEKQQAVLASLPADARQYPDLAKFPELASLLDGNNNDNPPIPKLKDFHYFPDTGVVHVDVNMDQNLTAGMTSEGVKILVSDIYTNLYHNSSIPIHQVVVGVYGPLEDRYGKTTYDIVYGTKLSGEAASKVNWADDKSDLETTVIPGLWEVYYNFKGEF